MKLRQTKTLVSRISKRKLTWFGHVLGMEDNRLSAKALCCYVYGKGAQEDKQRNGWKT